MPVYYENSRQPIGQVKTLPGAPGEEPKLDRDAIMALLGRLMEIGSYKPVEIKGEGLVEQEARWITPSELARTGAKVSYDETLLELRIHVPPELRKVRPLSLRSSEWETTEPAPPLPAAAFSGYTNLNATESFYFSGAGGEARGPVRGILENAFNYRDHVLESSFTFQENQALREERPAISWTRGDIRLVHDYPSATLRQQLLDLSYGLRGFQGYLPLGGFSLSSEFSMQPSKLTIATGSETLFLQRPSKVAIILNGQAVKTVELPAGRHQISDFPFRSGPNEYTFVITDDLGRTETISGTYYSVPEILRPGLSKLSYSIGFPSRQSGFGKTYDTGQLSASAYHVYGLSEQITVGGNFQRRGAERWLAGAESSIATPVGLVRVEPSFSKSVSGKVAPAFRLSYYLRTGTSRLETSRAFTAQLERRFAEFASPAEEPLPFSASNLTFGYGQALSASTSIDLSYRRHFYGTTDPAYPLSTAIGLGLSNQIGSAGNVRVNLQQATDRNKSETTLSLFFSWSFGAEHQMVSASYNPSDDSTRLNWNYSPGGGYVGDWSSSASVQKAREKRSFDGAIQYVGNRAVADATANASWTEVGAPAQTSATVHVGTALAFAGGRFGLGRPVINGFALVSPERNLKGEEIRTAPASDDKEKYRAATDWLGASVYADLAPYNTSELVLDTRKVTPGKIIEQDHFRLSPAYKSGYAIVLGTDASISVLAKLFDEQGRPLSQVPGAARNLEDPSFPPVPFFTSRSGKTRIEGFKPGRYLLELQDPSWEPLEIQLREEQGDVIELGALKLKQRKP